MKNILVTGANGQLGNEMRVLSAEYKEYTCFFTDVAELDICDEQAVMTFVKENNIHVIVNCAAYTAVDKEEDDIELCTKLNKNAVSYLAKYKQGEGRVEFSVVFCAGRGYNGPVKRWFPGKWEPKTEVKGNVYIF